MSDLLRKARTRVGAAVIGAAVLAVGGTATAAVVVNSPATDEVSDDSVYVNPVTEPTSEATTEAAQEPVAPTVASPPVAPPVQQAPAATVNDVTEPTQTQAPQQTEASQEYDPTAPWVDPESGATYVPAPEVPVEKLPGEDGYVPPAG